MASTLLEPVESSAACEEKLALLDRIVASRHFAKSGLLSRFLRHICDCHISSRDNELTEQQIGVRVFGRPPGYDCGEDNIVRNYARQLRNRLEDYYREEGFDERLRLAVPRGGYKATFTEMPALTSLRPETPISLQPADVMQLPLQTSERNADGGSRVIRPWMLTPFVLIFLAVIVAIPFVVRQFRHDAPASDPMHAFWAMVFRPDRDTVIVTADSGFGTLQDMLGRRLSLEDYTSLRLGTLTLKSADRYVPKDLTSQRYTSMTDLETAVALSQLPEAIPSRLSIRFARDLRMEDLKDNNIILLGSAYTNPWSELFEKGLNFELQGDAATHAWRFVNLHPQTGEAAVYQGERDRTSHQTYARIAWVPNIDRNGHILMLQGLDMAGTQAAAQSLLHGGAADSIWSLSKPCRSPDASFEVLLGTTSIGSNAGTIHVLAKRMTC